MGVMLGVVSTDRSMMSLILDDRSRELLSQYRATAAKLKKRFMKKPNVPEASEDFGKLANAIKNEENHQFAAVCFRAMAKCDQMINDTGGEAEAWANAGRQFWLAEEKLYASRNYSYQELLDAGTHCFLMAAYAHEKQGNNLLAASFYMEGAHKLHKFERHSEEARFLQHASDLQLQTPEWRLQALEELSSCKIRMREYSSALNVLGQITTECSEKEGPYRSLKERSEISQFLLLTILQPNKRYTSAVHAAILDKYSSSAVFPSISAGDCEMSILLQSITMSIERRDYNSLCEVVQRLRPLLNPIQDHLLHLVTEEHSHHHPVL